jgi:hypothetical protein
MDSESATPSSLTVAVDDDGNRAALRGVLDIHTLVEAQKSLAHQFAGVLLIQAASLDPVPEPGARTWPARAGPT